MIEIEKVYKSYGTTEAVSGISCTVPEGKVTVLIGPSGCGKSTTLRMINRLISPDSGSISVQGEDILSYRPEELRRNIGYVIQGVGLFPHLTVKENISVVPKLRNWDKRRMAERADELMGLIGLEPDQYRGKYPRELSGGEAQRIGVARALAADPPVLLMDEPFGAVDPLNREVLQREFMRIQKELKKTVLFVTHDLDEAILLADNIILMKDGIIAQEGNPEELLLRPADDFVEDFVGKDRTLKHLSKLTVEDYMTSSEQGDNSNSGRIKKETIQAGSTLRQALAQLLKPGITELQVTEPDSEQIIGFIGWETITRASAKSVKREEALS